MTAMARVRLYESDPLLTFVERADEWDDYYEIPADLLAACEAAEAARTAAVHAVAAYIREHGLSKVDPMGEQ